MTDPSMSHSNASSASLSDADATNMSAMNERRGTNHGRTIYTGRALASAMAFAAWLVIGVAAVSATTDDEPARSAREEVKRADSAIAPRALGRRLIDAMPAHRPGYVRETCFLITAQGEPLGHAVSTLKVIEADDADKRGKRLAYEYSDVSTIRGPSGHRTEMRTSGWLSLKFQPELITWEIIRRDASGEVVEKTTQTMSVGEKEITLRTFAGESNGNETKIRRPSGPFVHLAGHLFHLLPLQADQRFMLQDVDADLKKTVWRNYAVTKKPDGRLRIGVSESETPSESGYYIFDKNGEIAQHGAEDLPFVFERTTRAKIEELERAWKEPPVEQPDQ